MKLPEDHICWYPSAGSDLSLLFRLSERNCRNIPLDEGQELPDLFILTDVDPCGYMYDLIQRMISMLRDGYQYVYLMNPGVRVISVKELAGAPREINNRLCGFSETKPYTGKAFHIRAELSGENIGSRRKTDIIYAFCENTAFARDVLLKHMIPVEYAVQIRYGHAFGGSYLIGDWYKHISGLLGCKYFISNPGQMESECFMDRDVAERFFDGYELRAPEYREIFRTDGTDWDGFHADIASDAVSFYNADVVWYRLIHS